MRLALCQMSRLACLLLPLSAACAANVFSSEWSSAIHHGSDSAPAVATDDRICVRVHQHLRAINADGQKKRGPVGGEDHRFDTSPAVLANGSICCVSRYGTPCNEDPEGGLYWKNNLYGPGYGSPAVGPTGASYVPDCGVAGVGFSALRAGAALARTPWPKFRGNARNTGNIRDTTP